MQGRGQLSAAKLKEQLAGDTGPDGAESSVSEAPAWCHICAQSLGKRGPDPAAEFFQGREEWERAGGGGGGTGKSWIDLQVCG